MITLSPAESREKRRTYDDAKRLYKGKYLDYRGYQRHVFAVEIDDMGNVILCARGKEDVGFIRTFASDWNMETEK
jgi:hypothetical protein